MLLPAATTQPNSLYGPYPHPTAPSDAPIDANGECARAGRVAVGCCDGDGALGWPRAASRGHVVFSGGLRGLNTVPATAVRPSRGSRSRQASSGGCLRLPACSPAWRVVSAGDSVNMCVAHGLGALRPSDACKCFFSRSRAGSAVPTASIMISESSSTRVYAY